MLDKKRKEKRKINNIYVIGIMLLISLVIIIGAVIAQSQEDLEAELAQLIGEITDSGYSWLVNYTGELPVVEPAEIEVYMQDNDTLIAKFTDVGDETGCNADTCVPGGCSWNISSGVCEASSTLGYEGFGTVTRGALDAPGGYTIYHVTSLADTNVNGTLRYALDGGSGEKDSQYIVFDVGGTIIGTGGLRIHKSYITIDGSTAPNPGITIDLTSGDGFYVESGSSTGPLHDIIINNLRLIGPGASGGADLLALDAFTGTIYNVIIDHCTVDSAGDGAGDMVGNVSNVTRSWNLIMDTDIAMLMSVGAIEPTYRKDISIHHNVFGRSHERLPRLYSNNDNIDIVNNIVYGWGFGGGIGLFYLDGSLNPSANVENNVLHMYDGGWDGHWNDPEKAIIFERGPDEGNVYFNNNIVPVGETSDVSNSPRLPIPSWAQVTMYNANTLNDTVVPFVGTQYPTQEEQDLLNNISAAIG
jgi:hypothetical protein